MEVKAEADSQEVDVPLVYDAERYREMMEDIRQGVFAASRLAELPERASCVERVLLSIARKTADGTLDARSDDKRLVEQIVAPWRYLPKPGVEYLTELVSTTIENMWLCGILK